jgi:hypothetical protein
VQCRYPTSLNHVTRALKLRSGQRRTKKKPHRSGAEAKGVQMHLYDVGTRSAVFNRLSRPPARSRLMAYSRSDVLRQGPIGTRVYGLP